MINPLLSQALSPEPDLAGEGRLCRRTSDVPSDTLHRHRQEGGCGGRGQKAACGKPKGNGVQAGGTQLQMLGRPGQ